MNKLLSSSKFPKVGYFFSSNSSSDLLDFVYSILGVHAPFNHARYLSLPSLIGRNKTIFFYFAKRDYELEYIIWGVKCFLGLVILFKYLTSVFALSFSESRIVENDEFLLLGF